MADTETYEIWRHRRGLEPERLFTLHDPRDVDIIMKYFSIKEEGHGIRSTPSKFGGFTADLTAVDGSKHHFVAYWVERGMTDEEIDDGRVEIFDPIKDAMAEAMLLGALDGKARRNAAAYGQPLERSEGE